MQNDALLFDGTLQPSQDVAGRQGPIGPEHMALARVIVQESQDVQGSATPGRVCNEVPRPNMIAMGGSGRPTRRQPTAEDFLFRRRNTQASLPSPALDPPLADRPTFPTQQCRDPSVARRGCLSDSSNSGRGGRPR